MTLIGDLRKLRAEYGADGSVRYALPVGEELLDLTPRMGQRLSFVFRGRIHCVACGRATSKSFSQGYCFPCAQRLAECDLCIVSPEKCHYGYGTCRDAAWAQDHCMQDHYVYLANTSGLKVGITRATQIPTRWIDQGATQGLALLRVRTRRHAGLVESVLRGYVTDRTDWRRLLKGDAEPLDLASERDRLLADAASELRALTEALGVDALEPVDGPALSFRYPVQAYPSKVNALGFDKGSEVEGVLLGIKGQYLVFDCGVLNVRKFSGYNVEVAA